MGMNRRTFLKISSLGAAMAATGVGFAADQPAPTTPGADAKPASVTPVYRTLGRTGMKVTVIGIGALQTPDAAIFQAAFDRGVNYVDTARVYLNGRSERLVGEALKGYRDKVYVATKIKPDSKDSMRALIKESLGDLKVDYVDLMKLHGIVSKDEVNNKDYREVFAEAKKQGQARFIGVTVHKNEAEVLDAVTQDPEKLYDAVLVTYNFKSNPQVKAAIERAAQAGIGIVAMKTQAGGYDSKEFGDVTPHQAALKWVLQDKNVAAAVPGMISLNQVVEDTAVMGMMQLTQAEIEALKRYEVAITPYYCHRCDACRETCPMRVNVSEINRSLMYAEGGYHDLSLARSTYRKIPAAASAAACGNCAQCTAACPYGVNIGARMRQAQALFT